MGKHLLLMGLLLGCAEVPATAPPASPADDALCADGPVTPEECYADLGRAELARLDGDPVEADALLETAVRAAEAAPAEAADWAGCLARALVTRAEVALAARELEDAEDAVLRTLDVQGRLGRRDEAHIQAWRVRGDVERERGRLSAAWDAYQAGLLAAEARGWLLPQVELRLRLARIHHDVGDEAGAVAQTRAGQVTATVAVLAGLSADPRPEQAQMATAAAQTALRQRRLADARTSFEEARRLWAAVAEEQPWNVEVQVNHGISLIAAGIGQRPFSPSLAEAHLAQAIAILTEAIDAHPRQAVWLERLRVARREQVAVWLQLHRRNDAAVALAELLADLQAAAIVDPGSATTHGALGETWLLAATLAEQRGRQDEAAAAAAEAVASFRRAATADPESLGQPRSILRALRRQLELATAEPERARLRGDVSAAARDLVALEGPRGVAGRLEELKEEASGLERAGDLAGALAVYAQLQAVVDELEGGDGPPVTALGAAWDAALEQAELAYRLGRRAEARAHLSRHVAIDQQMEARGLYGGARGLVGGLAAPALAAVTATLHGDLEGGRALLPPVPPSEAGSQEVKGRAFVAYAHKHLFLAEGDARAARLVYQEPAQAAIAAYEADGELTRALTTLAVLAELHLIVWDTEAGPLLARLARMERDDGAGTGGRTSATPRKAEATWAARGGDLERADRALGEAQAGALRADAEVILARVTLALQRGRRADAEAHLAVAEAGLRVPSERRDRVVRTLVRLTGADVASRAGDAEGARRQLDEASSLLAALAAEEPTAIQWPREQARAAWIRSRLLPPAGGAVLLEEARVLLTPWVEKDIENGDLLNQWRVVSADHARALAASGQGDAATQRAAEGLSAAERLWTRCGCVAARIGLIDAHEAARRAADARGDHAASLAHRRAAHEALRAVADRAREDADLASLRERLGPPPP